jgi:hypothetical protein
VGACDSEKTHTPEPVTNAAVYGASTNDDGVANVENESGETVFTAVAADSSGTPLAGLEVTYFGAAPELLVAFNDAATGEPLGTFAATPGVAGAKRDRTRQSADGSIQTGVFILDMLDIGGGRLYDPSRDGFQPVLPNTLEELRARLSYDDVEFILNTCPGIEDFGERSLGDIGPLHASDDDRLFDIYDNRLEPEERMAVHRVSRLATWAIGRPSSYRVHIWRSLPDGRFFFIPVGAQVIPTIDAPQNGHTVTDESQRVVSVSGRLHEEPVFLTADGGHVEIYANGVHLAGALSVGGDGSGKSVFSIPGGLQLVSGENRLEVVAYVGEAGWGFATPVSGEVGRSSVTVNYEPSEESADPALSALNYTPTVSGPDGTVPINFHFRDGQADIARFHWKGNGEINGQVTSGEFEHAITEIPDLAGMIGTVEGNSTIFFKYGDVDEGGWFNIEFWIIDAAGHSSNHLMVQMTILAAGGAPSGPGPAVWTISGARD